MRLLARRLQSAARIVFRMNDQLMGLSRLQVIRDIHGKRDAAAEVVTDFDAIHVDGGVVVDGTAVQEHALARPPGGGRHIAAVPNRRTEIAVSDAGKRAFRSEGDRDGEVEQFGVFLETAVFTRLSGIHREGPRAIQVHPSIFPPELHARVFGAGTGCRVHVIRMRNGLIIGSKLVGTKPESLEVDTSLPKPG